MDEHHTAETADMAKTQKTLFLQDELCQLIQAFADSTGTNFTKVVTAAVLEHFFWSPQGPQPMWMRLAAGLDKEKWHLHEIPSAYYDMHLRYDRARLARCGPGDEGPARLYKERIHDAECRKATWEGDIKDGGGELKGVIDAAAQNYRVGELYRRHDAGVQADEADD